MEQVPAIYIPCIISVKTAQDLRGMTSVSFTSLPFPSEYFEHS
jgi:hypothetical protein